VLSGQARADYSAAPLSLSSRLHEPQECARKISMWTWLTVLKAGFRRFMRLRYGIL
jgi:hypothetical protein